MGRVGGLATAVLAWAVGATIAQTPMAVPAQPAAGAKPVAIVNGEPISAADLETVLKLSGPVPMQLTEGQKKTQQMEALGLLIDELLMHQFLVRTTPAVPPAEIDKKYAEMEAGLKKQGKSLQEFCRDTNQTETQVRNGIAHMIQWTSFARARVSDADVEKYYQEYRDFFDGLTVRVSHIVVRVPSGAPEAERVQARAKLTELRKQIVAGQLDFAAAAKAHSQDPSAPNGGDLGFVPRKWYLPESFTRVAFALPVGQVSDLVETDFGVHLIKVTERKPGPGSDFAKIKDAVREFCVEEMRQQLLTEERKTAKIEINLP
jgi:peptidyl-prolyl cis-trans isomerase C